MQETNVDKQIQELLYIKIGLEKKCQGIFREILNENGDDPLNNLFKNLNRQNQQNKKLKTELLEAKDEIKELKNKLKLNNTINTKSILVSPEKRNSSLLASKQSSMQMQNIEEKKKEVANQKEKFLNRMNQFIIFLLKCIKEISRSHINNRQDIEQLVAFLEKSLEREKMRVFQLQSNENKNNKDIVHENRNPQQKLKRLVTQSKNQQEKQQIFGKIFKELGLELIWTTFINSRKLQSQMYYYLRDLFLDNNCRTLVTNIQEQKNMLMNKKLSQSQKVSKICQNVQQSSLIHSNKNNINQILKQTQKTTEETAKNIQILLIQTMKYFFNKLDDLFVKHNQHPFKISNKPNFMSFQGGISAISEYVLKKQWEYIKKFLKQEIDSCFNYIDRKTKFHAANRMVLKIT